MAHVVDMDDPLIVRLHDIFREKIAAADILAHFTGEVVPHGAVDDGVFVRVLLDGDFIVMPEKAEDPTIRGILLPLQLMPQAVLAVVSGETGLLFPQFYIYYPNNK